MVINNAQILRVNSWKLKTLDGENLIENHWQKVSVTEHVVDIDYDKAGSCCRRVGSRSLTSTNGNCLLVCIQTQYYAHVDDNDEKPNVCHMTSSSQDSSAFLLRFTS